MSKTKIACVQMDCEIGNVAANCQKVVGHLRGAASRGAEIVIFPECVLTGYCFDSLIEAQPCAEPLDGAAAQTIARACEETGVHAVVGFIESKDGRCYNSALLVGPRGVVGSYHKVHLPYLGVDRFLTPGDDPFRVFDLPAGKIGLNICYDASFPEPSRVLKLLGAELIILPTNWPTEAWRNAQFVTNARALENHVHFAAVNRVGTERGRRFIGMSKVVDCHGDTVAEAGGEGEEILLAELDLSEANRNRVVNDPGAYEIDRLADRRPELYTLISQT